MGFAGQGGGCVACGNRLANNARYVAVADSNGQESGCGWSCNAGYRLYSNASASMLLPSVQGTCSGGTVWYSGSQYATLDATDPLSMSSGGQTGWHKVPEGWSVAPNSQQSRAVIAMYPFGASYVLLSDGSAWYSSLAGSSAGQQAWFNGNTFFSSFLGLALSSGISQARILIVAQACAAGYYGSGGDGETFINTPSPSSTVRSSSDTSTSSGSTSSSSHPVSTPSTTFETTISSTSSTTNANTNVTCAPCTNLLPVGAVYASGSGAPQCGWTCGVGFFSSAGGCSPCNNSKPDNSVYATAGVPGGANNCS